MSDSTSNRNPYRPVPPGMSYVSALLAVLTLEFVPDQRYSEANGLKALIVTAIEAFGERRRAEGRSEGYVEALQAATSLALVPGDLPMTEQDFAIQLLAMSPQQRH